jgi:hypothetical protein
MQRSPAIFYGLLALGLAIGSSATANAALQVDLDVSGSLLTCTDNAACDANPAAGALRIGETVLDGVLLNEQSLVGTGGGDVSTSLTFVNGTGLLKHIVLTVSDSGSAATVIAFDAAGHSAGQTTSSSGWGDPASGQGAGTPADSPPALSVAEPVSLALLGSGIGLGIIIPRRRR